MSETIHGLKPGDKVYALPMWMHLGGPIGVDEFEVVRASKSQVTGYSTKRSTWGDRHRYTFQGCKFGTEWHLTPESALNRVISLMQKEIDDNQTKIEKAKSFLEALKKETSNAVREKTQS